MGTHDGGLSHRQHFPGPNDAFVKAEGVQDSTVVGDMLSAQESNK